jgi:hypothetical protein
MYLNLAKVVATPTEEYWLTTGAGAAIAPPVIALAGPRAALAPAVVLALRFAPAPAARGAYRAAA